MQVVVDRGALKVATSGRRAGSHAAPGRAMKCFVALPFKKERGFDELYDKVIEPAVETVLGKRSCSKGNSRAVAEVISDSIAEDIIRADVVIGVITGGNPNVMYEVGVAHSLRKPTLLLSDKPAKAPFDVAGLRIIGYKSRPALDVRATRAELEEYLREVRDNPDYRASNVLTRMLGHKYKPFVDDFRGKDGWLLGYLDVLAMEGSASTVWEINPKIHWVIKDPQFIGQIIENVRTGSRRYYYLVPNEDSVLQGLRESINYIKRQLPPVERERVNACLKYVAIGPDFFTLMPFSVVIYNDPSRPSEALLLEPMAPQIGADQFDARAGGNGIRAGNAPHRWEETTFDVRIRNRNLIDFLIRIFRDKWNEGIDRECAGATVQERKLVSKWRIE